MNKHTAWAAAPLLALGLAAGCGGSTPAAHATHSARPAAAPASTAPSCQSQATTWAHSGGGLAQFHAISRDLTATQAGSSAVVSELQSGSDTTAGTAQMTAAASQLGADSSTALSNPPPACVPGEAVPYRKAFAEYGQASQDELTAASDIQAGNITSAVPDIQASTTALNKGNGQLQLAITAVTTFGNGG